MRLRKEVFKEFLESSTIHGLQYISTEKNFLSKLLWSIIVFCGFSTATYLIMDSIRSWEESPISTSVETHPISEVQFPTVTICPPEGSNTALNYDIMNLRKAKISDEERLEAISLLWKSSKILQNNQIWKTEDIKAMYLECQSFSYQIQNCKIENSSSLEFLPNCTYEKNTCQNDEEEDACQEPVTTVSGRTCQMWSVQTPHKHSYTAEGENNICNDPSEAGYPWCYTTDPKKRWEKCSSYKCSEKVKPQGPAPGAECEKPSTLGVDYSGSVATTRSGLACKPWSLAKEKWQYLKDTLPNKEGSACRGTGASYKDPNGLVNNLWCYTMNGSPTWENCDVKDCTHDVGPVEPFKLWIKLFYVLTVEKNRSEAEIMAAIIKTKLNSTSKG